MPAIKFSHRYLKLPENVRSARLLQVFCCYDTELSPAFIDYDTIWFSDTDSPEHYPLPRGRLILLLFQADNNDLFTTLRPWAPNKEKWYRGQQGAFFDVIVSEEDPLENDSD